MAERTITVSTLAGDEKRTVNDADTSLIERLDLIHREEQQYRSDGRGGMSLEAEWEQNGHRTVGNHWLAATGGTGLVEGFRVVQFVSSDTEGLRGLKRSTINRTQNSIISNTAGQTQEPIQIRVEPTETADQPMLFLTTEAGIKLHELLYGTIKKITDAANEGKLTALGDPEAQAAIRQHTEQAITGFLQQYGLTPDTLPSKEKLIADKQLTDSPDDRGPRLPMEQDDMGFIESLIESEMISEDDVIRINDQVVTEVAQSGWDHHWRVAGGDAVMLMNEYLSNVYGNAPVRFQWHTEGPLKHHFSLENTHILNIWVDHTHFFPHDWDHVLFEHPMSLNQAKHLYPNVADDLTRAKERGNLTPGEGRRSAVYQTDFKRDMVVIRHAWLRWETVPMTLDEALDEEKVETVKNKNKPDTYRLADGGAAVKPPDDTTGEPGPKWPETVGIRQVTYIPAINKIIEDLRCPYKDIPFGWNLNLPRPDGTPFGQGEPLRLEDISQQINRTLSVLDNHLRYYQFPNRYWPAGLLNKLRSSGFQFHARPGGDIPIDEDQWLFIMQAGGFNRMTQDIPRIPGEYVSLLQLLLQEHDSLSGNVQVRQGREPFKGASGKAIESLATQATGSIGFKARFTEQCVERLAKIGLDAMAKWLPIDLWQKIASQYERPVLAEIVKRMNSRQWNVYVQTVTGRGVNAELDAQRAMQLYGEGSPTRLLSRQTAMRRAKVSDPEAELRRINKENPELSGQVADALAQQELAANSPQASKASVVQGNTAPT